MKYTILDFQAQFPTDKACLAYLFELNFGERYECSKCHKINSYYPITGRRAYACAWCARQVSPTAGTIFHKSSTSLRKWFFAIFLMSQSRNGVASEEIRRHLGVTYKTAFRITHKIRSLMDQNNLSLFEGIVEADETYIGGRRKGKRGRGAAGKVPVFGMLNRETGRVYAKAVPNVKRETLMPIIQKRLKVGATLMTDEMHSYKNAPTLGYEHKTVEHGVHEYVRGNTHTNSIEGFWSNLKRGLDGTHHSVSPQHLQKYVDEFVFRWNRRNEDDHLFDLLLARV